MLAVLFFAATLTLHNAVNLWLLLGLGCALLLSVAWPQHRALLQRPIALQTPTPRNVSAAFVQGVIGGAVGVLTVAVTHAVYGLVQRLDAPIAVRLQNDVQVLYTWLAAPPGIIWAWPLIILAVVTEEVCFRGLGFRLIERRSNRTVAVLGSAAVYACAHLLAGQWTLMLSALLLGLTWAWVRARTQGLAAPMGAHAVWSLAIFWAWPLPI